MILICDRMTNLAFHPQLRTMLENRKKKRGGRDDYYRAEDEITKREVSTGM